MKMSMTIYMFLLLLVVSPGAVLADLKVQVSKEADLPPSISPKNPINSGENSNNSVTSSDNSATNPKNTLSYPENSPVKKENGMNGNRRILLEADGAYYILKDTFTRHEDKKRGRTIAPLPS